MMKRCPKCKQVKPKETGFYKSPTQPGGFSSYCMQCQRLLRKKYEQSEKGKETVKRRGTRKSLYKIAARRKLRYAVTAGKVIKPTVCSNCHGERLLHGHHEDYEKPLEVEWLCDVCHKLRHGKLKDLTLILNNEKESNRG